MEIRPSNNSTMACKCSSESKSHIFLTLNQKPEMIKLMGKGMLKVERPKARPLAPVVNGKEKFLKEIKSAIPVNTRMIRN